MDFWERLDETILKMNSTRKAVASKVGVSVGNFATWKTRRNFPTADVLMAIAKELGTSSEFLLTGQDSNDAWIQDNRQLIHDLKRLTPDQLETVSETVAVLAAKNHEKAKLG